MPQRMEAEILFLDPADRGPRIAALNEFGFEVEILDWVAARRFGSKPGFRTELDESRFFDWAINLVKPLRGAVVEAGLADPQQGSA